MRLGVKHITRNLGRHSSDSACASKLGHWHWIRAAPVRVVPRSGFHSLHIAEVLALSIFLDKARNFPRYGRMVSSEIGTARTGSRLRSVVTPGFRVESRRSVAYLYDLYDCSTLTRVDALQTPFRVRMTKDSRSNTDKALPSQHSLLWAGFKLWRPWHEWCRVYGRVKGKRTWSLSPRETRGCD